MIQKKEEGPSKFELVVVYKSFNVDKTNILKWMKNKESIFQAASDQKKKNLFKIR